MCLIPHQYTWSFVSSTDAAAEKAKEKEKQKKEKEKEPIKDQVSEVLHRNEGSLFLLLCLPQASELPGKRRGELSLLFLQYIRSGT